MEQINKLKEQGQVGFNRLRDAGKNQPGPVKLWAVTAGSAVAGGVLMAATANGMVALLATLASPPVALAVGALVGGAMGWVYMQPHAENGEEVTTPDASMAAAAPLPATPEAAAAPVPPAPEAAPES